MASSLAKSSKGYRRSESRNKHSWWWDGHSSPKNSKWLAENVEEMDQSVKNMLELIEGDGDSFAKKAEMYYQKRPELVSHVEEFYRMYRSLAERYDNITAELRKNITSDLESQGSGFSGVSDVGSDLNPQAQPGNRAAGFDVFLKSGGSSSDLGTEEGDDTSTLSSESESDDSLVINYSSVSGNDDHNGLCKRVTELETELERYDSMVTRSDDVKEEKIRVLESDMKIITKNLNDTGEELRQMKVVKVEMEGEIEKLKFEKNELAVKVNEVDRELTLKDGQLDGLSHHLDQLHLEHVELVDRISMSNKSIDELTSRGEELEKEIARQREVIIEGAEEKREVIRQLCFSLEHYRDRYQMMRRAFMGHSKRHLMTMS